VPVHAYYGKSDASVGGGYAAWQGETNAAFSTRAFDGGHMVLHDASSALCEALEADLGLYGKKNPATGARPATGGMH